MIHLIGYYWVLECGTALGTTVYFGYHRRRVIFMSKEYIGP